MSRKGIRIFSFFHPPWKRPLSSPLLERRAGGIGAVSAESLQPRQSLPWPSPFQGEGKQGAPSFFTPPWKGGQGGLGLFQRSLSNLANPLRRFALPPLFKGRESAALPLSSPPLERGRRDWGCFSGVSPISPIPSGASRCLPFSRGGKARRSLFLHPPWKGGQGGLGLFQRSLSSLANPLPGPPLSKGRESRAKD